jgi:dienelactone hydrolase
MSRTLRVLSSAAVGAAAFSVAFEDVTVGGYVCGEYQDARVYYPDAAGSFPVVSFAHGYNNPGTESYACYSEMLSDVAAAGYVVIALESSKYPLECKEEYLDQLRSIEWLRSSSLASRADFGSKVGLLGHSMGGGATYHNAGLQESVEAQNIGAAVALHPQITSPTSLVPVADPLVPTFFGTGGKDVVVFPSSVKSAYDKASLSVPKVFSEIKGAVHDEPMSNCGDWTAPGQRRHTPFAIAMFDCHLKASSEQCAKIYGDGAGSLCSGEIPMNACEHANEPTLEAVAV